MGYFPFKVGCLENCRAESWSERIRGKLRTGTAAGRSSETVELVGLLRVNWGLTGNYKRDLISRRVPPVHWHCIMKSGIRRRGRRCAPSPWVEGAICKPMCKSKIALVINNTSALRRFQTIKFIFMTRRLVRWRTAALLVLTRTAYREQE